MKASHISFSQTLMRFLLCMMIGISCSSPLWGQSTSDSSELLLRQTTKFVIDRIEFDNATGLLNFMITARDSLGNPMLNASSQGSDGRSDISVENIHVLEDDKEATVMGGMTFSDGAPKVIKTSSGEKIHLLFLLDRSGSMREENRFVQAKAAIKAALEIPVLDNANVMFAHFESEIHDTESLTKDTYQSVVGYLFAPEKSENRRTDLYRALRDKVREMQDLPAEDQKILVLLTDGKNDTKGNEYYDTNPEINPEEVLDEISYLDTTYRIFPLGIGKDVNANFLQNIASSTQNRSDRYAKELSPDDLPATFKNIVIDLASNLIIRVKPNETVTSGEARTYQVSYREEETSRIFSDDKSVVLNNPISIEALDVKNYSNLFLFSFLGIGIIIGLLFFLKSIVPLIEARQFRRKYIYRYRDIKVEGANHFDPITGEQIQENDRVVAKVSACKYPFTVTKVEDWKADGNKCWECKDDCDLRINSVSERRFFDQQGAYRKLNWLWFGLVGGFLAWALKSIILYTSLLEVYTNILWNLLDKGNVEGIQISDAMASGTLIALAMGTALSLTLGWVEEIGQSRSISVGRILFRVLIGGIASYVIMFFFLWISTKYLSSWSIFLNIIAWLIIGTSMGAILAIKSSVSSLWNGVKSGFIAGGISALVFVLFSVLGDLLSEVGTMITYMLYGGILGSLMVIILAVLEDFSVVYLSPSGYSGQVKPLSRWLQSPHIGKVFIGTRKDCHLYVKWQDEAVEDQHAALSYVGGKVYLEPIGPTLINNVEIKKEMELKHGDIIQLGPRSISRMKFQAKKGDDSRQSLKSKKAAEFQNATSTKRSQVQPTRDRPKIIIRNKD